MLLKRTRPQTTGTRPQTTGTRPQTTGTRPQTTGTRPQTTGTRPQTTGTTTKILKLGSLLGAFGLNRIRIDFPLLQCHLWTRARQPARSHFACDGRQLKLIVSYKSTTSALNGLSIADVAGVVNDAPLDNAATLSKSSTHHARSLPST